MYLSDSDLRSAIESGTLIVKPPGVIGPTSIDLHLDSVDQARIWDTEKLAVDNDERGLLKLQLNVARMDYGAMSRKYLMAPPREKDAEDTDLVVMRDDCVVVRPGGFVLWQTKEIVGTPEHEPKFICFIDGKSTKSRTGLVVHQTAPTIHAGWSGNVTLEMSNSGPLHLVLHEGDAVVQLTVAHITSPPKLDVGEYESATAAQIDVTGTPRKKRKKKPRKAKNKKTR